MHAIASDDPSTRRTVFAISAGAGIMVALALALWASYGSAAFVEQVAAGLGLCF
jgi:hypothetical protein